jgi:hypothetical protein
MIPLVQIVSEETVGLINVYMHMHNKELNE